MTPRYVAGDRHGDGRNTGEHLRDANHFRIGWREIVTAMAVTLDEQVAAVDVGDNLWREIVTAMAVTHCSWNRLMSSVVGVAGDRHGDGRNTQLTTRCWSTVSNSWREIVTAMAVTLM